MARLRTRHPARLCTARRTGAAHVVRGRYRERKIEMPTEEELEEQDFKTTFRDFYAEFADLEQARSAGPACVGEGRGGARGGWAGRPLGALCRVVVWVTPHVAGGGEGR
jgi:hypothetical protein